MNNPFGRMIDGLFGPDLPRWAAELGTGEAVVVGSSPDRRRVASRGLSGIPPGALVPDLKDSNIVDREAVRGALEEALSMAGFTGSELALVIPDEAVRVTLLDIDSFPAGEAERIAFIRWKLKKTVPFDIGQARTAYQVTEENGSTRVLVGLSPLPVAREYEEVAESLGLHAGIVSDATTASFNLIGTPPGDVLFVKSGVGSTTTSIFSDGRLRFYRKVIGQPPAEAVYPTLMYYQDRLGGDRPREVILCGEELSAAAATLERELSVPVHSLYSAELEDRYKPALGALQV